MLSSALISALHVMALAIGLPGVFLRGRALEAVAKGDLTALPRAFAADNAWGIAAALWVVTGLLRAFGGFEKGTAYYLHHNVFWLKLGLFGLIFALELYPMVTLIKWRGQQKKNLPLELSKAPLLARLSHAELALTLVIPFVAAAMARGIGY